MKILLVQLNQYLRLQKKQKSNIVFKPFSIDEYKKRAEQSEDDIKMGRFIDIDDL